MTMKRPRGLNQDWTRLKSSLKPLGTKVNLDPIRAFAPWGFRELGLGFAPIREGEGPGEPPVGFVGGTTSKTEWFVFWAFEILMGPMGVNWTYQESFQGGRHVPGGSVADFVLYMPMQTIIVRVQTWRFLFASGAEKHQTDIEQKIALHSIWGEEITVDIYEQHFIRDESGQAVLEVCKDAMAGVEWPNPMAVGNAGDW
jgi:hypothetical protein